MRPGRRLLQAGQLCHGHVDANGQQVEGAIEDQMTEEPLADRFARLRRQVPVTCDGHDVDAVLQRLPPREHPGQRPLAVICRTRGTTGVPPLEKRVALPALCPHPRGRAARVPEDLRRDVRRELDNEDRSQHPRAQCMIRPCRPRTSRGPGALRRPGHLLRGQRNSGPSIPTAT